MLKKSTRKKLCTVCVLLLLLSVAAGALPLSTASAASAFADVSPESYYYNEVTSMASQGVVSGYGNGTFLPQNPVTNAEAVKLVCAMAGVDTSGYTGESTPWYADVWSWARDNGVVPSGVSATAYATREQICAYIAAAYQLDTGSTTTDAFSDTDSQVANTLYDTGVIAGIDNGDGTVSFGGSQNVKRCDACIMLYRLAAKVAQPNWPAIDKKTDGTAYTLDKSHYVVSKPETLTNYRDYVQAWDYMLVNKCTEESWTLSSSYTDRQLDNLMTTIQNAYYSSAFDYMEYAAFLNQWGVGISSGYERNGRVYSITVKLDLSNAAGLSTATTLSEISTFEQTCDGIVTQLFADGSLSTAMSVKERAHVLYKYIAQHTKYDNSSRYYNGYDAAVRGSAVCQGYTSEYNYLCNIAGVPMEAMTGYVGSVGHAWSRIEQSGTYYNVDSTWGDAGSSVDDEWFWVSDEYLKTCDQPRTFDIDSMAAAA